VDFARYNNYVVFQPNCRVINYNTSEKTPNDIVVPFWTFLKGDGLDTPNEKKRMYCTFFGGLTHPVRSRLHSLMVRDRREGWESNTVMINNDQYRINLSQSIFGLCPRGAGLSSYRFFECLHVGTIPVLIADDVVLPYEEEVNYSEFIVRHSEMYTVSLDSLADHLSDYDRVQEIFLARIKAVRHKFTLAGVQEYVHRRLSE
jgi:hypothetical protein